MTSKPATTLQDSLAGQEFAGFLAEFGFVPLLDFDGDRFSCTVFENEDFLLAFLYEAFDGENVVVAERGSPVDPAKIVARSHGWHLIGIVWRPFYDEYNRRRKIRPYPHRLDRAESAEILATALREFTRRCRGGEISIGTR